MPAYRRGVGGQASPQAPAGLAPRAACHPPWPLPGQAPSRYKESMRRFLTPVNLIGAGAVLLAVVFGVLWLTAPDKYVFLPDKAHPVAPLVTVKGERPPKDGGGIYFVD